MRACLETPATQAPQHEIVLFGSVLILRSDFADMRNRDSKDEAAKGIE
jgi:hypothetical protein